MWQRSLYLLLALSCSLYGAEDYWTAGSGNFTNDANWSAGLAPNGNDNPIFTNNSTIVYTFSAGLSVTNWGSAVVRGTNIFDLGGSTWYSTNTTFVLATNNTFNGTAMILTNGTLDCKTAVSSSIFAMAGAGGQSNALLVVSNFGKLLATNLTVSTVLSTHNSTVLIGKDGMLVNRVFNSGASGASTTNVSITVNGGSFTNESTLTWGASPSGYFNFKVLNGGLLSILGATTVRGSTNMVEINGSTSTGSLSSVSLTGNYLSFMVTNGAYLLGSGAFGISPGTDSYNNKVIVTGSGTIMTNTSLLHISTNASNTSSNGLFLVENGAQYNGVGAAIGVCGSFIASNSAAFTFSGGVTNCGTFQLHGTTGTCFKTFNSCEGNILFTKDSRLILTNGYVIQSNTVINLTPSGTTVGTIISSNFTLVDNFVCTVSNWTGTTNGGTANRIYSANTPTPTVLSNFTFAGSQWLPGAQILATGEIVPKFTRGITNATILHFFD